MWIAFGTGSNFHYIPVHEVVAAMDPRVCATLHVFHAFTGCDTTSSFGGRGKKTAWNTWKVFPEVSAAFEDLLLMQDTISNSTISTLERFVILLYDRTSDLIEINEARKQLCIYTKVEEFGKYPTNIGSTRTTYQKGKLPVQLLEQGTNCRS